MLPQSYQYRNLSEGADRVGGQLHEDKKCPFSGVTKSGRVWRKMPESGARSVGGLVLLVVVVVVVVGGGVIVICLTPIIYNIHIAPWSRKEKEKKKKIKK